MKVALPGGLSVSEFSAAPRGVGSGGAASGEPCFPGWHRRGGASLAQKEAPSCESPMPTPRWSLALRCLPGCDRGNLAPPDVQT